jgi:hypothetical protein
MRPHLEILARARLFGLIAVAALSTTGGICGPDCAPPGVVVQDAEVISGHIAWKKGEEEAEQSLQRFLDATDLDDCWLQAGIQGFFTFACHQDYHGLTNAGFAVIVVTSDPRVWAVGEVPQKDLAARLSISSNENCSDSKPCTTCTRELPGATVRAIVEEATGGLSNRREGVTEDFLRRIRLEFDLGPAVIGEPSPAEESCSVPLAASGVATIEWKSSDFAWSECP